MTDHFELSTMIGTRRDLGLGGDQVQKLGHGRFAVEHAFVHVDVDDVGAGFDLLAGDGDGLLDTCSSWISRANFFEPVTLVRSPIMMKLLSGRSVSGSSPLKPGQRLDASAACAAALSATASAIARMCGGVVPQQPPTMFSQPLAANSPSVRAIISRRLVEAAKGVGQAGVGIATDEDRRDRATALRCRAAAVPGPARSSCRR